nr:hypothetical protein [Tanacetum cinerariifolium]
MRRVGKGFLGVETPLFENMLTVRTVDAEEEVQVLAQDDDVQEHAEEEVATDVVPPTPTSPSPSSPIIPSSPPHQSPCQPQPQAAKGSSQLIQQVLDTCSALVLRVEGLETTNAAQQLEIIKLKDRVKKLERLNKVKSSKLRRLKKVGTSQHIKSSDDVENVFNQGRISVDIETDEGIELEVDQEKSVEVAAASTPAPAAKPKILKIAAAALAVSTRRRKGVPMKKKDQVEIDAEYAKKLQEELDKEHGEAYKNIDWNAAFDHVQDKETQYIKRYHGFKKKPQSESEACKNMISYLKNTEAKKRKLSEEAQEADDLRRRLEIVQDEDDDVFVESIPLAQKVPVVDYQVKGRQEKIYNIDLDHTSKVLSMQEDLKVQEVVEVVNAAKLMTEVVTAATTQVIPAAEPVVAAVSTPVSAAKPKVLKVIPAAPTVSTKKRKGVVIRDPEEELHDDTPAETQSTQ